MRLLAAPPKMVIHVSVIVAIFAAMTLATYSSVLLTDWNDLSGRYDVNRYFGPQNYYTDYVIHHGEIPLWNPLTYCGMPHAANPQLAVFYPPNLIRSLLTFNPTPRKTQVGLALLMGLHVVLAGVGTFYFARSHRLSYYASFVAASAFIFSAIWVRRVCEYHFITQVAWMPFLLLLMRTALASARMHTKLYCGLAMGLLFGISLLAGWGQIAVYLVVTLLGYYVLYRLMHLKSADGQSRPRFLKMFSGDMLVLSLLFIVGAIVASAVLWPGLELASFSGRMLDSDYSVSKLLRKNSLSSLYQNYITFVGMKYDPENIRGAGLGVLFLVLAAVTHRRHRDLIIFGTLFYVLLDCSLGPPFPFYTAIEWLMPYQTTYPTRAFDFALFPLALLAGFGVDAATATLKTRWRTGMRCALLVLAGVPMLISLARWTTPHPYLPVSKLVIVFPAAVLFVTLAAGIIRNPAYWRFLLVVLVFGETLAWNLHYVPFLTVTRDWGTKGGVHEGGGPFWQDNYRGADPSPVRDLYDMKPAMNGYEPLRIARARRVVCSPAREKVYKRMVYDAEVTRDNHRGNLFLKRSFWLARQYVNGPLPKKSELFPATTTVFLQDPPELPLVQVEAKQLPKHCFSQDTLTIPINDPNSSNPVLVKSGPGRKKEEFRLPTVDHPGRHSALRLRYTSTCRAEVFFRLHDPSTGRSEFGKTCTVRPVEGGGALLEVPLPDFDQIRITMTVDKAQADGYLEFNELSFIADQADEDRFIKILRRRSNCVELEIGELPDNRILTFLDAAYPGWKAYVDSRPVPIYLANEAFKAILVPPGRHHVEFRFRPWRVYTCMAVSLFSILGVSTVLVRGTVRRRKVLRSCTC